MDKELIKVFISHSSLDKEFARKLASDLNTCRKIEVWFDEFDIQIGDSIPHKVEQGIQSADAFICILSPNFVDSDWAANEWAAAAMRAEKVKIFPVMYKDCKIPALLRSCAFADFREPTRYESSLVDLLSAFGINASKAYGSVNKPPGLSLIHI